MTHAVVSLSRTVSRSPRRAEPPIINTDTLCSPPPPPDRISLLSSSSVADTAAAAVDDATIELRRLLLCGNLQLRFDFYSTAVRLVIKGY